MPQREELDIDQLITLLTEFDALRQNEDIEDEIQTGSLESIQPKNADSWPAQLHPGVVAAIKQTNPNIQTLYQHQYDAIEASLSGKDVVMESPTASGKTLAFTAPMLHTLLEKPGSHALMIYPMKALAFDQREQIRQICDLLEIGSFPYDGDTDPEHRKILREHPPHILLTNPEYLNMSFLGNRELWDVFLRRLRYIVIDEMHIYRGFFGSNMALLLRRFFLHLNRIGVSPRVFLSTATCANPLEHAKNLIGDRRDIALVPKKKGGIFRPERNFIFVKPDIPDYRYRDILRLRVVNAGLTFLSEGLQTLIFCPSKRFLESALRDCKSKAEELGLDPSRAVAFHADMKADDRQETQQKIKAKKVDVIFTTNALEVGIDIGGLDGVVLAGFPPSVMSAWQQIGRAGRAWDKKAFVLLYAMNDPIDQFFAGNINAFLDKKLDELVIDPSNIEPIKNHLPSLIAEAEGAAKLKPSDEDILGEAFYQEAVSSNAEPPRNKRYTPQIGIKMRGIWGESYKLKRGAEEVGQISEMRKFREAYIGAVFTFLGQNYRVHAHEADAVILAEYENQFHKTDPLFYTLLFDGETFEGQRYNFPTLFDDAFFEVFYGTLTINMNFGGYKLVDERSPDELIESSANTDAHNLYNHHAFSIALPDAEQSKEGLGALEHMMRVGAMFSVPADRFDASTFSKGGNNGGEPSAYYYENYPGRIGIASKLYEVWPEVLKKGVEIAQNCECKTGCQNCIEPAKSYNLSNANIDKNKGIQLAEILLASHGQGPTHEFENGMMFPVNRS